MPSNHKSPSHESSFNNDYFWMVQCCVTQKAGAALTAWELNADAGLVLSLFWVTVTQATSWL